MRILKITFQNLNSLRGQHTIDLEEGLLGEAGIFAITGPTGAGKSTLLDAITLALFGKAARYGEDPNPGDVMTRGEGECMAEVHFACREGRFLAKWTRHRARGNPDGALQNPKRQIADLADGRIRAEKLREADALIEELTGLDYQRFLRSVLLAQGRFKEFLDAKENERGDLLEKITGTHVYSLIGKKAYEVAATKRDEIKSAEQALEGLRLKTAEELDALHTEEKETQEALKKLDSRFTIVEKILQRAARRDELRATALKNAQDLQHWSTRSGAFAPRRANLEAHQATLPFQAALLEFRRDEKDQAELVTQIAALTTRTGQLRSRARATLHATLAYIDKETKSLASIIEKTVVGLTENKNALATSTAWIRSHEGDARLVDLLPRLQEFGEAARSTHARLISRKDNLDQLKNTLAEQKGLVTKAEGKAAATQTNQKSAQEKYALAQGALTEAAENKPLDHWQTALTKLTDQLNRANALQKTRKSWEEIRFEQERLLKEKPALEESVRKSVTAIEEQETLCKREDATLADKRRLRDQAQLIASLDEHRARLQPEEPCPLCGSREHPFAEHRPADPGNDEKAVAAQEAVVKEAARELTLRTKAQTKAETALDNHTKRLGEVKIQLQKVADAFTSEAAEAAYPGTIEEPTVVTAWVENLKKAYGESSMRLDRILVLEKGSRATEQALQAVTAEHRLAEAALKNAHEQTENTAKAIEAEGKAITAAEACADDTLTAFNAAIGDLTEPASNALETTKRHTTLAERYKRYLEVEKEHERLSQAGKGLQQSLTNLDRELKMLAEERNEWAVRETDLGEGEVASLRLTIPNAPGGRRNLCDGALNAASQSVQSLAEKQADAAKRAAGIEKATTALIERLASSPFATIAALEAAQLDEPILRELTAEKDQLQKDQIALESRRKDIAEEKEKLAREGLPETAEIEPLRTEHAHLKSGNATHNQRLGEIKNALSEDKRTRTEQARQIADLEKLRNDAKPWEELSALIGSATGDKFSRFAQGLTLAQLLLLANRHLHQLNERYQILRIDGEGLGLQIVDRFQADALRPTHSLSGGESFLVSLALALGLSDLAGSDTRIESLFIDEGFGTLDAATLDVALAALENLRMDNRTIGIISHVETLKQRISAQVQVSKTSEGFGRLEIVNAR